MNHSTWVYPPAADIDALEQLGNPGWNWSSFQDRMLKVEK